MKIDHKVIALKGAAPPDQPARVRDAAPAGSADSAAAAVATHLPLAAGGEFDAARVAQIRAAIAAGHYQVDASRIADGLIDHVQDLLGRKP